MPGAGSRKVLSSAHRGPTRLRGRSLDMRLVSCQWSPRRTVSNRSVGSNGDEDLRPRGRKRRMDLAAPYLTVISVATGGGGNGGVDWHTEPAQDPRPLARRKARQRGWAAALCAFTPESHEEMC